MHRHRLRIGYPCLFDAGLVVHILMGQKSFMDSILYFQAMEVGRPEMKWQSAVFWVRLLLKRGCCAHDLRTGCCAVYG